MANSRKHDDRTGDEFDDSSSVSSCAETSTVGSGSVSRGRTEIGLTDRLADILVDEGDGDLLLQRSDREDRVLQWLQALDMQVMGACRADERLKPMLKVNASSGMAEDHLLVHLSQHFEPSEVGMLARCFCIPLVSIRAGKINKQGTLLCPTTARGNLNLTLLPTSDLRLSFVGDDGNTERLFTLCNKAQGPLVTVEEISSDSSGRSFIIKIEDGRDFYFWCSEKSKLLGNELLSKMKDILKRRPSIAELTGISKSRLDCFAAHLRTYLVGRSIRENAMCFPPCPSDTNLELSDASYSLSSKSMRSRHVVSQAVKANTSYQGSLSPRSSSFKEGLPRSLSCLKNAAREKLKRRGDGHLATVDDLMISLPRNNDASSSVPSENEKVPVTKTFPVAPSNFLETLGKLAISPSLTSGPLAMPSIPSLISPYYCWCPQGASNLQHPSQSSQFTTTSSIESPLLPPLSSLLSAARPSSLLTPTPSLSLAGIPSLDFPALLPEPLVRLPIPGSQQIPTFTPLMCDPIVHIPVIDVCSSGQGYLVSAGPTISSSIPPLHPQLVNPLIPEPESVVEKNARETLRLLISSSTQSGNQLMDALPAVLTNDNKKGIQVVGSRGLYAGASDVNAICSSMAAFGLASLSESSKGDDDDEQVLGSCDSLQDESGGLDRSSSGDNAGFPNI